MMRKIPVSINAKFNVLLNTNKMLKRYQKHYLKWLRYYLDFCHKYGFSESNPQSLPKFVRKLKEKRQTDEQQKQANQAIHIYYELIRLESRNKKRESSIYLQKPQGVNEAKHLYRATPSRLKLQTGSIRHDSAKNKTVKTRVKENWQAVYRQLPAAQVHGSSVHGSRLTDENCTALRY